jgi:hypothetical protein
MDMRKMDEVWKEETGERGRTEREKIRKSEDKKIRNWRTKDRDQELEDGRRKGFSHILRARYDQEYGRYEPCFYLNVLTGQHISLVGVHGFKGSGVQGSILIPGLHLGCVFTIKASVSSGLIQHLKLNWQLPGKMNICNEDFESSMPSLSLTLNVEP